MHNDANALLSSDTIALTIFAETIPTYVELRLDNSSRGIGAMNYSGRVQGRATHTGTTSLIRPTASDFVADVENSAYAVLCPKELGYFARWYATGRLLVGFEEVSCGDAKDFAQHLSQWPSEDRELVRTKDRRVRVKLGAELRRRGIAPICDYFAAVDVRGGKHTADQAQAGRERAAERNRKGTLRFEVVAA